MHQAWVYDILKLVTFNGPCNARIVVPYKVFEDLKDLKDPFSYSYPVRSLDLAGTRLELKVAPRKITLYF